MPVEAAVDVAVWLAIVVVVLWRVRFALAMVHYVVLASAVMLYVVAWLSKVGVGLASGAMLFLVLPFLWGLSIVSRRLGFSDAEHRACTVGGDALGCLALVCLSIGLLAFLAAFLRVL